MSNKNKEIVMPTWRDKQTPVNAANLNSMVQSIKQNSNDIKILSQAMSLLNDSKFDKVVLEGNNLKFYAKEIELFSITLPTGSGGSGVPGQDGREIELRKSSTHIEWRYVGESNWTQLVSLNELKGNDGVTPNITIGNVETLSPGSQATVTRRGTTEAPIFDFGIPQGQPGGGEGGPVDLSAYQTKRDENLTTTEKEIVAAINEVASDTSQNTLDIKEILKRLEALEGGTVEPTIPVQSITLNHSEYSIAVDDTLKLIPSFTPENATNKNVTWSSCDDGKAIVNTEGLVTATGTGNCIITCTTEDGNKVATCNLNIEQKVIGYNIYQLGFTPAKNPIELPPELTLVSEKPDFVHPSMIRFKTEWNGFKYWLAVNPYPITQSSYENPCLVASNDLINWTVKGSIPIYGIDGGATHNSDCHIFMDKNKTTMHYINRKAFNTTKDSEIEYFSSDDGVNWTARQTIIPKGGEVYDYVSPSVCYKDGKYYMFVIDLKNSNRQTITILEATEINGEWTKTRDLVVDKINQPWHMEAKLVNDEFILLIQDRGLGITTTNGSQGGFLWLGKLSTINSNLELRATSILEEGTHELQTAFYKSTFDINNGELDLIYGTKTARLDNETKWRIWNTKGEIVPNTFEIPSNMSKTFEDNFERIEEVVGSKVTTEGWSGERLETQYKFNNGDFTIKPDTSNNKSTVYKNISQQDYILEFRYKSINPSEKARANCQGAIIKRLSNSDLFYFGAKDNKTILYHMYMGNITKTAFGKISIYEGCLVQIKCVGELIECYIDGKLSCQLSGAKSNSTSIGFTGMDTTIQSVKIYS